KQTMFAAQQLLLAVASLGLVAAPMEGFDARRVCFQLGIPIEQYTVPLVVSVGYAGGEEGEREGERDEETSGSSGGELGDLSEALKRRYRLEDVCFQNKYGNSLTI
ncbi:hypothetical protein EON64_09795, partial [archaeon]